MQKIVNFVLNFVNVEQLVFYNLLVVVAQKVIVQVQNVNVLKQEGNVIQNYVEIVLIQIVQIEVFN